MATPEQRIKSMINRRLEPLILDGKLWKFMPVQSMYGSAGLDYLLCVNSWFIAIEAKKEGKISKRTGERLKSAKPTTRQEETMRRIKKAGGLCFVVSDKSSLDKAMQRIMVLTRCE